MTEKQNKIFGSQHDVTSKVLNEKTLTFFCNKYKYEIGHGLYNIHPCPRIRYVIDRNQFGYADFGDFFFWRDGGLYVWQLNDDFIECHNPDIVKDYFGESCKGRGYAFRSIFAGIDTGYNDSNGKRMFTGDIVMVKEHENSESMDLCLASMVDIHRDGFYGFPLDNHCLTLGTCKINNYHLERIGTVFFQLDPCEEPVQILDKALHYNNARCDTEARYVRQIMAKYTPNFDKEEWKYLGLEILGTEFDWNK